MSNPGDDGNTMLSQPVCLSVPASRSHVRVARLTAAVVAERLDFDIDAIDDVLVAVDELTNAIIQARPTSEIMFRFSPRDHELVVDADATVLGHPALSELARQVLGAVVDRFELSEQAGHAHFRANKSAQARLS
jgi:serine/threonine-protein kinase RsbW